jgi:hypothetical protein
VFFPLGTRKPFVEGQNKLVKESENSVPSSSQIEIAEEYKLISLYIFIAYCLIRSKYDSNCTFICCVHNLWHRKLIGGGGVSDALKIFESNFISSINCRLTQVRATGTDVPIQRHINYRLALQGGKYFY